MTIRIPIGDIPGFRIGHAQDEAGATGCTVILCGDGATAGVDVRGGGPASRDLFDTRLMDCLTPRPAQVQSNFWKLYDVSPMAATTWYYRSSQDTDYIRRYRIKKDLKWKSDSPYGKLDITINLSKPEKDPKAIAARPSGPAPLMGTSRPWG